MLRISKQIQPPMATVEDWHELYRNRWLLTLCLGLSIILLVGWGYVITPRSGPVFFIWLGLAMVSVLALVFMFGRSIRLASQKIQSTKLVTPQETSGRFILQKFSKLPLALLLLMLAGFVFYLSLILGNPQPLRNDAFYYSDQAYALLKNGYVPNIIRPPGYALFLAAIYKVVRGSEPPYDYVNGPPAFVSNEVAVWVVQAGLLTLSVGIVYLIVGEAQALGKVNEIRWRNGKIYWGQPLPLLAAGLMAFCPFIGAFAGVLLTETVALFWLVLTILLWLKVLRFPRLLLYPALLGVSLAWLMETRPTFIYLPVLVLATLLWCAPGRWKIIGPGIMLATLLLFFIPQSAANAQFNGSLNPVISGDLAIFNQVEGIFWETNGGLRYQRLPSDVKLDTQTADALRHFSDVFSTGKPAELQSQSLYWHNYFDNYLKNNVGQFAITSAKRLWYQWDQHYVYAFYDPAYFDYRWLTDNLNRFYLIFGLVGLVLMGNLWKRGAWPLWLSLVYLTVVNAVVRTEFRYTLPAYPILLIGTAVGLAAVISKVGFKLRASSPARNDKARILNVKIWGSLLAATLLVGTLSATLPVIPNTTADHEKALNALDQASDYQRNQVHNVTAARAAYNMAVQLEPLEPQVYLARGQFLQNQTAVCDKVQARTDFEKYLQIAPADASARLDIKKSLQNLPLIGYGCGQ